MAQVPRKRLGFFTRLLDRGAADERYRLAEEQIAQAEALGFDAAWIAQHHFHPDEGGLPAPTVFLAHVAARTRTIRLGTGVITLPMENAIRVAEDTAVLDLLAKGRLEVGFGTGGTRESFAAFGIDSARRGEVYGANLKGVRDAWAGRPLAAANTLYPSAPGLRQRTWLATFSSLGAHLAGEGGDGLMLSRTQPRSAGAPEATLWDIQNPLIDAYLAALPPGRVAEAGQRIEASSVDDLIRTLDCHVGTPDDVITSLQADTALARATDIVFQVHSIDPPHSAILRSLKLTAEYVAPGLGWSRRPADAGPAPGPGAGFGALRPIPAENASR